jgi:hypothetical protein
MALGPAEVQQPRSGKRGTCLGFHWRCRLHTTRRRPCAKRVAENRQPNGGLRGGLEWPLGGSLGLFWQSSQEGNETQAWRVEPSGRCLRDSDTGWPHILNKQPHFQGVWPRNPCPGTWAWTGTEPPLASLAASRLALSLGPPTCRASIITQA